VPHLHIFQRKVTVLCDRPREFLGGRIVGRPKIFSPKKGPKFAFFCYAPTRMVIGRRRAVFKVAGGMRMAPKEVLKNPIFTEGSDEDKHNFPTSSSSGAPDAASCSPRTPLVRKMKSRK
jgi:hypothetical protein